MNCVAKTGVTLFPFRIHVFPFFSHAFVVVVVAIVYNHDIINNFFFITAGEIWLQNKKKKNPLSLLNTRTIKESSKRQQLKTS